jgi:hypothetical protein
MTSCGLWPSRRRQLVAVVVDDDGRASPALRVERTDDARWELLGHLDAVQGLDCELVVSEDLVRVDPVAHLAVEREMVVWVAPWRLVDAIRAVSALGTGPPARTAAMLARMALVPAWRGNLRRLGPTIDRRQLPLL